LESSEAENNHLRETMLNEQVNFSQILKEKQNLEKELKNRDFHSYISKQNELKQENDSLLKEINDLTKTLTEKSNEMSTARERFMQTLRETEKNAIVFEEKYKLSEMSLQNSEQAIKEKDSQIKENLLKIHQISDDRIVNEQNLQQEILSQKNLISSQKNSIEELNFKLNDLKEKIFKTC